MNRKDLLRAGGVSLAVTAVAPTLVFNPREAYAQGAPFKVLSPDEVATIEALSDALVPGAKVAGVSHYIDHELASPDPRLLLRFSQLTGQLPPYYHNAIAAFNAALADQKLGAFATIAAEQQHTLIEALRTGTLAPWAANALPPASFYGMMRNDGVDVVYGSVDGFKNLGMPYMPHILPKTTW